MLYFKKNHFPAPTGRAFPDAGKNEEALMIAFNEITALYVSPDGGNGNGLAPETPLSSLDAALDRVRELQERVMRVSSLIYGVGHHNSSFVKGVKCALSLMGICSDTLAEPREPFNTEDREKIRSSLVTLGALAQ